MNDPDTRELLIRAVGNEPYYAPDLLSVMASGGRLRRRRRALTVSSAAVGTCAVVAVAMVTVPALSPTASPAPRSTVAGAGGGGDATGSVAPTAAATSSAVPSARDEQARPPSDLAAATAVVDAKIEDAIRESSPASWTLVLKDADSSAGGIEGTADDGQGDGLISVGVSTGSQQIHPCSDPEFKAGASCTERLLPSGAVLSRRGLTTWDKGAATFEVVITYPDGSGINAEAGNYSFALQPTTVTTEAQKRALVANMVKVNRPSPTYSLSQLEAVALAVDAAIN
jgi:hypothetical protein